MSYNVDTITILKMDARIRVSDVRRLLEREDELPEDHFLGDLELPNGTASAKDPAFKKVLAELRKHDPEKAKQLSGEAEEAELIPLTKLNWRCEGSGHAWDFFQKEVAKCIVGTVEAVVIWEGGDTVSGFKIEDGKFTEMDVEYTLVPQKKKKR